jgi:hypothetical protein
MGGFGFFSNPILGPLESLRPGRLDIREIRGAHHRDEDLRLALHSNGGSNIFAAIEVSRESGRAFLSRCHYAKAAFPRRQCATRIQAQLRAQLGLRPQVDEQLHFRGLLDQQVGGFLTLEDPAGIDSHPAICIGETPP